MGSSNSKKKSKSNSRNSVTRSETLDTINAEERRLAKINATREKLVQHLMPAARGFMARCEYEKMLKMSVKRRQVASEILKTEISYCAGLVVIDEVFLQPLMDAVATKRLGSVSESQVRMLFPELETMQGYNRELQSKLAARVENWHWTQCVGDVFLECIPFLKMYTNYVNSYPAAIALLDKLCGSEPQFRKIIERGNASKRCHNNDLASFLITPVQRVPRYVMLIGELLKFTPEGHVDRGQLSEAHEQVKNVATLINERKREAENFQKLLEIYELLSPPQTELVQPHRFIRCRGKLMDYSVKKHAKGKEYIFFVFNDILIKAGTKVDKEAKHAVKETVALQGCKVAKVTEKEAKLKFAFRLTTRNARKVLVLQCRNQQSCDKWVDTIAKCLKETQEKAQSFGSARPVTSAKKLGIPEFLRRETKVNL